MRESDKVRRKLSNTSDLIEELVCSIEDLFDEDQFLHDTSLARLKLTLEDMHEYVTELEDSVEDDDD